MDRSTYLTLKKLYADDSLDHGNSNLEQTLYELLKSTRILTPDKEFWALNQVAGYLRYPDFREKHYENFLLKICATRISYAKSSIPFFPVNKRNHWIKINVYTAMFIIKWRPLVSFVAEQELLRIKGGQKNILYNFYVKDFLSVVPDNEFTITWLLATAFDAFWCHSIFNMQMEDVALISLSYVIYKILGETSEIRNLSYDDRLIIYGAIFYNTLIALCANLAQSKNDYIFNKVIL